MNRIRLELDLARHEGKRTKPYRDTNGHLTVGIGRNIDVVPFSEDEIALMFTNDLARAIRNARFVCRSFDSLDSVRQEVLVNMAYNIGAGGLSKFRKFLDAIDRLDFTGACNEMLNSVWASQVGARAHELARRMRYGDNPPLEV